MNKRKRAKGEKLSHPVDQQGHQVVAVYKLRRDNLWEMMKSMILVPDISAFTISCNLLHACMCRFVEFLATPIPFPARPFPLRPFLPPPKKTVQSIALVFSLQQATMCLCCGRCDGSLRNPLVLSIFFFHFLFACPFQNGQANIVLKEEIY